MVMIIHYERDDSRARSLCKGRRRWQLCVLASRTLQLFNGNFFSDVPFVLISLESSRPGRNKANAKTTNVTTPCSIAYNCPAFLERLRFFALYSLLALTTYVACKVVYNRVEYRRSEYLSQETFRLECSFGRQLCVYNDIYARERIVLSNYNYYRIYVVIFIFNRIRYVQGDISVAKFSIQLIVFD